ncbi:MULTISPECIES: thioesterase family protein [Pseudomonas fluorescens group]|uniref:Thioesterase family protein n=1 Tax=Pseudomonas fluorescens TaxID=294 RepID=A0AAE2Q1C1_PSEFL|nr:MULTISPECIES: thioesterase family protein [Pseudomonas fluorescens group]MBA1429885.1 thioesterase [Pseudomonas orientalis]MBD8272252.1 thioesterase family protein [Pseudomonas fluorescens]UOB23711.1 thioesterase family protein [Pseudomonas orientalis]
MPALTTYTTKILPDWVDYNGHLRDAFYLLIFSYATDALMDTLGLDSDNREASGHSLFTLELHLNYLHEVKLGAEVEVHTQLIAFDAKRLHLFHSLHLVGDDKALAGNEQMLLHVDLAGPQATPFSEATLARLVAISAEQAELPRPALLGRVIGLPAKKAPNQP